MKTAEQLAECVIQENSPIDWHWLKHIKRTSTDKELLEWCKYQIEPFSDSETSKHKITRAANILKAMIF